MSDQAFHFCILFSLIYIERLGCVRGPQIQEGAQIDTAGDTDEETCNPEIESRRWTLPYLGGLGPGLLGVG